MTEKTRAPQNLRSLTLLSGCLPVSMVLVGRIQKPLVGYDQGSNDETFEPSPFKASTHWVGSGPPSIIGTETKIEGRGVPLTVIQMEVQKR